MSKLEYTGPYTSKGKRISKSMQHDGLWSVTIIGTNMGYNINMSTATMYQNNPPDPIGKVKKVKLTKGGIYAQGQ